MNVFYLHFYLINASLLNKSINFFNQETPHFLKDHVKEPLNYKYI